MNFLRGVGSIYTFKNRCEENANLQLKDGTEKIFFNCTCGLEDIPEKLKALYDYIVTGKAESKLTEKLEEAVERARRNQKWRSEYMKELLHEEDIKEEALAQGREEKSRFKVINLYKWQCQQRRLHRRSEKAWKP